MKNNRATVLVFSCDKYEDVWYPFFTLMDKYWSDCRYRILLNTESKSCNVPLKNIQVDTLNLYTSSESNIPYGRRCKDHLKNIDSEYVITLMDDFFIRSKVDTDCLERIMDWMDEDPQIASFCLLHHDDRHSCKYLRKEKKYENFSLRPRYCNHNYDMQACVWRKSVLYNSWKDFMSPWEWEGPANYRSFDDGFRYYDLDDDAPFPIDYIDYKKNEWSGVRKGKWVKETVLELFEKEDIEVDYSIRGWYNVNEDRTLNNGFSILNFLREIRCYGWRRFLPALTWKITRKIRLCVFKTKNLPENYCEYLRRKYYEKH